MSHPLLPDNEAVSLKFLELAHGIILFHAEAIATTASCPAYTFSSDRVHSRYIRTLQDLPWQDNPVRIKLTLAKFFCDNPQCHKRVFCQQLPDVARRYQRQTARLQSILLHLVWKLGV